MYLIGSILFWIFLGITMVLMFIPASLIWIFTIPFDKNRKALHLYSCFWAALYIWFNPFLKVRIEGKENIRKDQTYVYCPNHQSMVDILILYMLFRHFKWVSKIELMRVPVLGWNMWLNGYLRINRKDPSSQIKMMRDAEKYLNQGSSIMIFPEGTRSKDGSLGKFRGGAFILAEKTGVPLVPIAVSGTREVFSKGPLIFRKFVTMTVSVLEPVKVEEAETPKAMGRLVRQRMADHLGLEEMNSDETSA